MKNLIQFIQCLVIKHFNDDFNKYIKYEFQHENFTIEFRSLVVIGAIYDTENDFSITVKSDNEINFVLTYNESGLNLETFTPSYHSPTSQIMIVQFSNVVEFCKKRKAFFSQMAM